MLRPKARFVRLLLAITLAAIHVACCAAFTAVVTAAPAAPVATPAAGRLNVVFILADDLGWAELGSYGQQKIPTPNIDRLAAQGMRFTQHYSGAPVCAPSRCVLMTGKHLGHAEIRGNRQAKIDFPQFTEGQHPLTESALTFVQLFQKAGYATGAMGKWGLGPVGSAGEPNKKGFDLFFGYNCQAVAHSFYPPHLWRNAEKVAINARPIPGHAKQPKGDVKMADWIGETYAPRRMTAEAEKFIADHAERPFFLYLPFTEPHVAMHPPQESVEKFPAEWDAEVYRGANGYLPHPRPRAAYAAMIHELDNHVGRVLAALDRAEIAERTLVVFTSDNGATHESAADPRFHVGGADPKFFRSTADLRGYKGSVYEGGLRVPMIARLPGRIPAGTVNDSPSYFADWFPTLCDAAGLDKPAGLDGESLWPALTAKPHQLENRKPMLWVFPEYGGQVAVRLGDFKVVRRGLKTKTPGDWEVYDLSRDRAEQNDLSAARPELIEQAVAVLRREVNDNRVFPLTIPGVNTKRDSARAAADTPNIIVIIADDLGYGDVSCYGATRVQTPAIDRLAREGRRFTSGYCSASTCTPTRFSLLTGTYAFRHKGTGIAPPNGPAIIRPGAVTLPALLQRAGYATAAVGKWHLGLGDPAPHWNGELRPGPLDIGFDHCFILPTTNDRVPQVYVEDRRVKNLDPDDPLWVGDKKPDDDHPTGLTHRSSLKMDWSHGHNQTIHNGISRIGFYTGGSKARFRDEDLADAWVNESNRWIEAHRDRPFFLYFASQDIHVPRIAHERFQGKSPLGPRGDCIVQLDWCVGELLKTLDRLKLTDNTLIVFCSDNGPVLDDGYKDDAVEKLGDHEPAGPYRGGKYSVWEGGTRTPFITRWPGHVTPGVSDEVVCTIDLPASCAALVGQPLPADACLDSFNLLGALLGQAGAQGRDHLLQQDNGSGNFGLRAGPWKLVRLEKRGQTQARVSKNESSAPAARHTLYRLDDDPGERTDLSAKHPDVLERLVKQLDTIVKSDRSRPQSNE